MTKVLKTKVVSFTVPEFWLLCGKFLDVCRTFSVSRTGFSEDLKMIFKNEDIWFFFHVRKFLEKSSLSWMEKWLSARKLGGRAERQESFVEYIVFSVENRRICNGFEAPDWPYSSRHGIKSYTPLGLWSTIDPIWHFTGSKSLRSIQHYTLFSIEPYTPLQHYTS